MREIKVETWGTGYSEAEWDTKYAAERAAKRERGECSCDYTRKFRKRGMRYGRDYIGPIQRTWTDPECPEHGGEG